MASPRSEEENPLELFFEPLYPQRNGETGSDGDDDVDDDEKAPGEYGQPHPEEESADTLQEPPPSQAIPRAAASVPAHHFQILGPEIRTRQSYDDVYGGAGFWKTPSKNPHDFTGAPSAPSSEQKKSEPSGGDRWEQPFYGPGRDFFGFYP